MNATSKIKDSSLLNKQIWIPFIISIAIITGTFNNIFSYLALILSIILIITFSEEDAFCFLIFIMPFANIFKRGPESQSFFTYLILIFVGVCALKKGSIGKRFLTSVLSLCIFLCLQMFFSINALRMIKFIANLLLIYYALNAQKGDSNKILLFYILGIATSSIVAILNIIPNLSYYIGAKELGYAYENLTRFSGMYADPNYYAVNVIISLCLIVILNHKKQLGSVMSFTLAVLMVVFAIMTYSKSAFLMLLLPFFMLFYSRIKRRKYFLLLIFIVVGIMFGLSFFAGKIDALDIILSRFNEADNVASFTTGRSTIWIDYMKYLLKNPMVLLFGKGLGADLLTKSAAHNTYIDLLYYLGVFGSILLINIFKIFINVKGKKTKRNFLNYGIWICILIMYFFLSELFYFDWAFHIIIAILVSKTNMENFQKGLGYEKIYM